jgi:hypothetical protein
MLFQPGQIVATIGALSALSIEDIMKALSRHLSGDWGDLSDEDKRENDFSVKNGFRILSSYSSKKGVKFWVITEADRSVTTVLLPEEY